jgi:hypothetical protein
LEESTAGSGTFGTMSLASRPASLTTHLRNLLINPRRRDTNNLVLAGGRARKLNLLWDGSQSDLLRDYGGLARPIRHRRISW